MLTVGIIKLPSRIKKKQYYQEIIRNREFYSIQGKILGFSREYNNGDSTITLNIKDIHFSCSRMGENYESFQVFNSLEEQLLGDIFLKITYIEKGNDKIILKI